MERNASRAHPLLAVLLIAAVIALGEYASQPPAPLPADAPTGQFSALRAMATVEWMAQAPRPAGSAAHAQVAGRLAETLRELGGEVEHQRRLQTFDYARNGGDARFAMVDNIVARWPGSEPGPALLLMSHYDSAPAAPGAGDAASGVAAIIETLRALQAGGESLRNPLIVLFTDGEETGLFGAQAFFAGHRWAADVGLVLNFDARGSAGPIAMFETSGDNGALIAALAGLTPAPIANSLVYSAYRQMPNDTDLSIARAAGYAGMNFAFVHGFFDYHRPTDTPAHLSPATLQDLGNQALALTRHFGNAMLPPPAAPDRHYFNPFGRLFVHYPPALDLAGLLLAGLLLIVAARRRHDDPPTRRGDRLRALAVIVLALLLPLLLVTGLNLVLAVDVVEVIARQRAWWIGWSLLAGGLALLLHGSVRPATARAVGPLWRVLWWSLAALLTWQLPGAAHVLVWPLLALAVLHATRHAPSPGWTLLAALPACVLLGGTAATFDALIGFRIPAVSVLPLLLLPAALAPLILQRGARATGVALLFAGALTIGGLAATSPWTARTPRGVELFVLRTADGAVGWASRDRALLDWHRARLGDTPERRDTTLLRPDDPTPLWYAPLPGIELPPPRLELLAASEADGRRRLRLRLSPGAPGEQVALYLSPGSALRSWQVEGRPLRVTASDEDRWRRLLGFALPSAGVELQLELDASGDWPEAMVTAIRHGVPVGLTVPPRPPELMRWPSAIADSTVVAARFRLAPAP